MVANKYVFAVGAGGLPSKQAATVVVSSGFAAISSESSQQRERLIQGSIRSDNSSDISWNVSSETISGEADVNILPSLSSSESSYCSSASSVRSAATTSIVATSADVNNPDGISSESVQEEDSSD